MKRTIKQTLEKLSGGQVWLEKAADPEDVAAFVAATRVVPTKTPLVRVGNAGEGGYLLPDDLDGLSASVSPGVSTEISFDLAMAERGLHVFMADASVEGPPQAHPNFHFTKKFLGVVEDESTTRLDGLCRSIPPHLDGDQILQMDIEGAEYQVILDASDETLGRFRIMAIEFHHLDGAFGRFPLAMIRATFDKLGRTHRIVHIHPNNVSSPTVRGEIGIPPVMEFIFHRRDRVVPDPSATLAFPHPLDADNVPDRPAVPLPRCWYA